MASTPSTDHRLLGLVLLGSVLATAAGCGWINEQLDRDKSTVQVREASDVQGTKHLAGREDVGELLSLTEQQDASVLVVTMELDEQGISDAHLKMLTDWIEAGGVLWVAGEALDSGFVHSLVDFASKDFAFQKSATGKRGGELIVRGLTPNLKIHEHPLTEGVERLYVYPNKAIEAVDPRDTIPLVEMTDSDGRHGVVLAARQLGEGFVVLDGTARYETTGLPGFDPAHPNAERTSAGYEDYDWEKLYVNAVELAQDKLQESGIYARPSSAQPDQPDPEHERSDDPGR